MEKNFKKDKSKIITVGPSESMSKSKKNTIDPENIISDFGADAARLFILSDNPIEKMFSGRMRVSHQHLNFYKNYGTYT